MPEGARVRLVHDDFFLPDTMRNALKLAMVREQNQYLTLFEQRLEWMQTYLGEMLCGNIWIANEHFADFIGNQLSCNLQRRAFS